MKYRVRPGHTFIGKDKTYPAGSLINSDKEQVKGQLFKLIALEDYVTPKRRTKPASYKKAVIEDLDTDGIDRQKQG